VEGKEMKVVKPPVPYVPESNEEISVFLAGTIDMGNSEDWQTYITRRFKDFNVTFLNPRRDDWNPSWEQSIENEEFVRQVNWELNNLERATYIFMYFAPDSQSPISLLELGAHIDSSNPHRMIVCCPKEFYRKGNVDIFCQRNNVEVYPSLFEAIEELENILEAHGARNDE